MYHDDHILFDELERQRKKSGGMQRKALRLPLYAPSPYDDEQRAAKDEGEDNERGVRVLDMCNGYSVVE